MPSLSATAALDARSSRCAGTATATRTGPTGAARSPRWPRRPGPSATSTSSSPTTARASPSPTGLTPSGSGSSSTCVAGLNEQLAPFRILTGIEVDILEDGSLDQDHDLLAELDVVVASVHSKLRMESPPDDRTHARRHREPAHRHPRPLHRPPHHRARAARRRAFDAEAVFSACAAHRHGRRDQLAPRTPGPAPGPATPGRRARLLVQHRHRRPCARAARVAPPWVRAGRRRRCSTRSRIVNRGSADVSSLAWTGLRHDG